MTVSRAAMWSSCNRQTTGLASQLLFGLLVILMTASARSQPANVPALVKPDARYKADLLLVVAHPDDETAIGGMLAKLSIDDRRRVAIVYCNRGTGGGNSVGNEQSTAMGLEREIEARRAAGSLGIVNVWFLDGIDVPTQDVLQSLARWKHGAILEELIRIVRLTRPEVIITWLPHFVAGENHGDHQASGVIATEAFDAAGDPTVFPSQVAAPRERIDINQFNEGLHPWQAKKIYYLSDASHELKAPGPSFDLRQISPARGISYARIAATLDTFHLTQGDVSVEARKVFEGGDDATYIESMKRFRPIFGKSHVACKPDGDLFEGVTDAPLAYKPPTGYRERREKGLTLQLGGVFAFYRDFWRSHDIEHLGPLVVPEMEIGAGSYVHVPLMIDNNTSDSAIVTLTPDRPDGWRLSSGASHYDVGPHEVVPVQTFAFAPPESRNEFEPVVWTARANGKVIGTISINVKVSEWTLPE